MSESELAKRQALIDLLALPDGPDLRRGHRVTIEGSPTRYEMIAALAANFIQHHLIEEEDRMAVWQ